MQKRICNSDSQAFVIVAYLSFLFLWIYPVIFNDAFQNPVMAKFMVMQQKVLFSSLIVKCHFSEKDFPQKRAMIKL